jgi:hypothetical protein
MAVWALFGPTKLAQITSDHEAAKAFQADIIATTLPPTFDS